MHDPSVLKPVSVSRSNTNPLDEIATRSLLNSTLVGDKYQCPRCPYATVNPEEMINHLEFEINRSINEVAKLAKPSPKRTQEL